MIPILLQLKEKKVLIVGGGKVALRKAKQMLQEQADVTILSPDIDPAFKNLPIHYLQDAFMPPYLDGYFLVYAATDDASINHAIVQEASQRQMLCGSATRDSEAAFYSMTARENDDFMLALSSKARFPYLKPVADDLMNELETRHPRMSRLYQLRPLLLSQIENKQDYFQLLYQAPQFLVDSLYEILTQKKGHLYIYHHNDPDLVNDLNPSHLQSPYLILSLKALETYQLLFHLPEVHWTIHPLVLYQGTIHQRILKMTQFPSVTHLKPLIADKDTLKRIISLYRTDSRRRYYIIHQRTNPRLKRDFEVLLEDNETLYTLADEIHSYPNKTTVIPFLVTKGTHFEDIQKDVQTQQESGLDIRLEETLLARTDIQYELLTQQDLNPDLQ